MRFGTLVAVVLLSSVAAYAAATKTTEKFGARVSYPAEWIDKGIAKWDLLNPDYSGAENTFGVGPAMDGEVMVSVIASKPMTLKEFTSALSGVMTAMDPSLKVNSAKEISVNGLKGYDVVYGQGSDFGRTRAVVFFDGGKRYTISATAFDTKAGMYDGYAPAIESVVQSFRVVR